jgi:hypothetical protein
MTGAIGGESVGVGWGPVPEIRFRPEPDEPALVAAAAEYRRLWEAEGERIVAAFGAVTGLAFAEAVVDAAVVGGPSQSNPLRLRGSYDAEAKRGTLIHELAHRLIRANRARLGLPPYRPDRERENHELIDLFLFDVWSDLYGEPFARRRVEAESRWQPFYREAWEATLALDRVGRAARLAALLARKGAV